MGFTSAFIILSESFSSDEGTNQNVLVILLVDNLYVQLHIVLA